MAILTTSDGLTLTDSSGISLADSTSTYILKMNGKVINKLSNKTLKSFNNLSSSSITSHERLSQPTISITNNILTITGTSNATNNIYLNNTKYVTTTDTTYDLSTLEVEVGEYTVKVIQDKSNYISSLFSNGVTWSKEAKAYTITPTLSNVTAESTNPTSIKVGSSATLVYTSYSGYTLPTSVEVTGATVSSWNIKNVYEINLTATNCLINNLSSYTADLDEDDSVTLTITADGTSYEVPDTLSFGTYTKISSTSATLVLSGLTEDLTNTIEAVEVPYSYTVDGSTLTLTAAPYSTSGSELIID